MNAQCGRSVGICRHFTKLILWGCKELSKIDGKALARKKVGTELSSTGSSCHLEVTSLFFLSGPSAFKRNLVPTG